MDFETCLKVNVDLEIIIRKLLKSRVRWIFSRILKWRFIPRTASRSNQKIDDETVYRETYLEMDMYPGNIIRNHQKYGDCGFSDTSYNWDLCRKQLHIQNMFKESWSISEQNTQVIVVPSYRPSHRPLWPCFPSATRHHNRHPLGPRSLGILIRRPIGHSATLSATPSALERAWVKVCSAVRRAALGPSLKIFTHGCFCYSC